MAVRLGREGMVLKRWMRPLLLMSPLEAVVRAAFLCVVIIVATMSILTTARINELNDEVIVLRQRRSDAMMEALLHRRAVLRGVTLDDYMASRLELESSRLKVWDALWFLLFWLQMPGSWLIARYVRTRRSVLNYG